MNTSNVTLTIRELMPEGFTRMIKAKSKELLGKAPDTSRISDIVSDEAYTSKYWVAVEAVAMEAAPELYTARMEYLKRVQQPADKAA